MAEVAARVPETQSGQAVAQVTVGVREAAKIAGVSTKLIRRWIRAGEIRADLVDGKFGPTWRVEVWSLPPAKAPVEASVPRVSPGPDPRGHGIAGGVPGDGAGVVASLLAVVREKDGQLDERRRELEAAAGRIGYLEAEAGQVKALTARAESLQQERSELQEEARRQALELEAERGRVAHLLGAVRLRTWTAGILLLGFVVLVAALVVR